ncbi:MAG: threonylcarbamoyl-AMP synthase [Candidatus Mcinerneyibacterium aminivorans]|uniref:L-threonylcarbamoyladenylate synthase n=1 Tax=Candidatus Mcinerneyibacterium aminivorans TaxID=2703815 RepID=A0A5D0MDT6_9BACT|nr:MAG: threonylcarbamoyl-AMP synthase [Candidatus Mcinerneyibacterium aminivorans]
MKVIKKENLNKIISILENDGVIIFPTDTVFGIGSLMGHDSSLQKLYDIKKRNPQKKIPLLVSDKIMIKNIISGSIPESMNKLINNFSPGGLTYIIRAKTKYEKYANRDGSIAVRIPDNDFLLRLISKINKPLFASSANISGKEEINNLDELKRVFKDKVDALIPGETKKDIPSTIISFMEKLPFFIRTGAISKGKIREVIETKTTVLFVCSGNTCRSPIAEEYSRKISNNKLYNFKSAGTLHIENAPISKNSKKIIKGFGGNPGLKSTSLNQNLVDSSDLILTMAKKHKEYVKINYKVDYVYTLAEFSVNKGVIFSNGQFDVVIDDEGFDIFDPVGGSLDYYKKVFKIIKKLIDEIKWKEFDD